MRAGHLLVASLVLSIMTPAPLAAQTQVGVPSIGSRLRVFTRGDRPTRVVGSVVRVTNDTLTLRDARGLTKTISLADARRIDLSRGQIGHPGIGAAIGAGVGLLVGGVIGSVMFSEPADVPLECAESFFCSRPTRAGHTVGGALLGGLVGGVAGVFVGKSVKTDRWTAINASSLKPTASVRPQLNGGAVASVALRF